MDRPEIERWKRRFATEVREAFAGATAPRYPFPLEAAIDTLFDLLGHRPGSEAIDATGEAMLASLSAFEQTGDVSGLLVKVEPFCRLVLFVAVPAKYRRIEREAAGGRPGQAFMLASLLKERGLGLTTNAALSAQPDELRAEPRFAEHVCRTYRNRNLAAHEARLLSNLAQAKVFESLCVLLVYAVASYREEIESALLVTQHRAYLERLVDKYSPWREDYLQVQADELPDPASDPVLILPRPTPPAIVNVPGPKEALPLALRSGPERPLTDLQELIAKHRRLLIEGEPGAGKTTALRCFAFRRASVLLENPAARLPLPLYLELKYCRPAVGKTIARLVSDRLGVDNAAQGLFTREVHLLLDGLNEVKEGEQRDVLIELTDLLERFHRLRVTVATRPAGRFADLGEFTRVLVRPLTDTQVLERIRQVWADRPGLERAIDRLQAHAALWTYLHSPFHLATLEHHVRREADVPTNLGTLVKRCVAGFLNREASQAERQTATVVKAGLLAKVAWEARISGRVAFTFDELVNWLGEACQRVGTVRDIPSLVEEFKDNALLEDNADGLYSFGHELYLDYFAATEMLRQEHRGELPPDAIGRLAGASLLLRFFCDLAANPEDAFQTVAAHQPTTAIFAYRERLGTEPEFHAKAVRVATENVQAGRAVSESLAIVLLFDAKRLARALRGLDLCDERWLEPLRARLAALPAEVMVQAGSDKVLSDEKLAELTLESLIQLGAGDALTRLGILLNNCDCLPAARRCLEAGKRLGNPRAALSLSLTILRDDEAEAQHAEAERHILECAEQGDPEAMYWAADLACGESQGAPSAREVRRAWLTKAAEAGEVRAMSELGWALLTERDSDLQQAERWLRKASTAGDAFAMTGLGLLLASGERSRPRPEEGEHWLVKAAEAGSLTAKGYLGLLRLEGKLLPPDPVGGERLLREAAGEGCPTSMLFLGTVLIDGTGVPPDRAEGIEWLAKSAEAGHPQAIFRLGERLRWGPGMSAEIESALRWLDACNPALAAFCRGWQQYLEGHVERAADLFAESARLGEVTAPWQLLWMKRRHETAERHEVWLKDIKDLDESDMSGEVPLLSWDYYCFYCVQLVLCAASGLLNRPDWSDLAQHTWREPEFVVRYWGGLARRDDPDGHLVLAMCARQGLIQDPDGLTVKHRLDLARRGGWDVPEWMNHGAGPANATGI